MALRKSTFLKLLALLLFSFELLAPVYLSSKVEKQAEENSHVQLNESTPLSVFSSLLYEEAGSEEEREGKESQRAFQFIAEVNFVSAFSGRVQSENVSYSEDIRKQLFPHNSLNKLYSIFRI